ncbi:tRNA lysidine(34) synthetase TilS [Planktotalea sp.]|uniref:tRNA lysidine(34) synthetase TilS n=1 Tax=Planktotalea sp. TaxID=2029877 RepID=UPI0025F8354E|nr:tRNA lysidine(34) synthetase TilS [Planktotalea sp.]
MPNLTLLQGHVPLGIALSGGSDSTALLVLAVDALGPENLRAVTIDHGLRNTAVEEASRAGEMCKSLGVSHDIVTLNLQDGGDLQARARAARYEALSDWAKRVGARALALGHTKNDVAETFLMRLARGSGVDGLAQMTERFTRNDTLFLRPLLQASRGDLQSMLTARQIGWSEDPSNQDPRFKRVQMRQAHPQLDALGLTSERLAQTAHWMRAASIVLEHAAQDWIAKHAWPDHGDAVFDLAALHAAPEETAYRVLTCALCNISENPYRPRLEAVKGLFKEASATTLHGCLIYPHKGTLRLTRELNAVTSTDPRWVIKGPFGQDHSISPLGANGLTQVKDWRKTALLPRRSLLASPAVWKHEILIAAPLAQPHQDWSASAPNPLHLSK